MTNKKKIYKCCYNSHQILCVLVFHAFTHGNFSEKLVLFSPQRFAEPLPQHPQDFH